MSFLRTAAIVIMTVLLLAMPVYALDEAQSAAAQVTVINVTLDPQVFMEGDTGTVTIDVMNTGIQSVGIRRASFSDKDIQILSQPYDTAMYLGAGNSMRFTFTVKADAPGGIYYPAFSLDFRDAGYLRYPVKLQVQNQPLEVSILKKPDTFSKDKKETVEVVVGNPRDNMVTGVTVYPAGRGIDSTPTSYFIGMLQPDSSQTVTFSITPKESTDLEIHLDYMNGINSHMEVIRIPVDLGESKKQAEPVLSNIQLQYEGGSYSLSGDVTNAGLEVANAVIITTGQGVTKVDPYRQYVVGTLQPDDFSSFEITFTAEDTGVVPVVVTYKDNDGNLYSTTISIEIPAATSAGKSGEGLPVAVIGLIIVLAAAIGGIVWYSWRKR